MRRERGRREWDGDVEWDKGRETWSLCESEREEGWKASLAAGPQRPTVRDGSITAHRGLCVRAMSFEMLSFCFKLGLIDTDASVLRGYYAQPEKREWTCEWTEAEVGAKNPKSCSWRRARGTCASVTSLNMLQLCEKSGASPHVCIVRKTGKMCSDHRNKLET